MRTGAAACETSNYDPPPGSLPTVQDETRRRRVNFSAPLNLLFPSITHLAAELRENSFLSMRLGRRRLVRGGRPAPLILGVLGCLWMIGLIMSGLSFSLLSLLWLVLLPLHFLLVYLASRRTVAAARADLREDRLAHLLLTPLTPREIALGWALTALAEAIWMTACGALAALPAALTLGPAGVVLLGLTLGLSLMHQLLAAVVSAGLMAGYRHRHEAASAGFVSAGFVYPLVFLGQALLLSLPVLALGLAGALLLDGVWWFGSVETGAESGVVLATGGFAVIFLVWAPLGVAREIQRQLEAIPEGEPLHRYLRG